MRKLTLALGAVALIGAPPVQAAEFNFDNYCISGSFQVCASVRVSTWMDGGQYKLSMMVWNLDGTMGNPHTLTSLGLYYSGSDWGGTATLNSATLADGTDISGYWTVNGANDIKTLGGIDLELRAGTSGNDGINGCTLLPGGTKWQTCESGSSSFPDSPYIVFEFDLSESFALSDLELRWHSQQTGANLEGSLKCDTGGNGDYPPCEVVPEPITMILLGSGLVGMGGARLARRRRRGLGEVEEV